MVNRGEALLNAVSDDRPKRLTGLGQKAREQAAAFRTGRTQMTLPWRRGATYSSHGTSTERGKPVFVPSGRKAARLTDAEAGRG
jgi:hypothetical protein